MSGRQEVTTLFVSPTRLSRDCGIEHLLIQAQPLKTLRLSEQFRSKNIRMIILCVLCTANVQNLLILRGFFIRRVVRAWLNLRYAQQEKLGVSDGLRRK